MSIISDGMKAKKILADILNGKITSFEEVRDKLGEGEFYTAWAKNIWEDHSTTMPTADGKIRYPKTVKEFKFISDDKYFIVASVSKVEAADKVYKITGKEVKETDIKFQVKWIKVN